MILLRNLRRLLALGLPLVDLRRRLDRELSAAGLPLSDHAKALRTVGYGRTIAARRTLVTESLRAKLGARP